MPRQIANSERRARTFRLPLATDQLLDQAAEAQQEPVNDIVIAAFNETLPLWVEDVPADVRAIMMGACINTAAALRALKQKLNATQRELSPHARAILMRDLLTNSVRNGINRLLEPDLSRQSALSHWCFAQADVEDLKLKGPVWDFVRSIGPTSPPPTERQIEEISNEITKLKAKAKDEKHASRLEVLNVLLGIAQGEHELEWAKIRRAEEEVRNLLTGRDD